MDGVGSLLDDAHYRMVEELWAELEGRFGVRGVYVTPYPHFSYHVAHHYDPAVLEPALRRMAQGAAPFRVRTSGLGVFTGAAPTLYVPVVRDPALTAFQRRVWDAVEAAGVETVAYYRPAEWVPHITIGFADLTADKLGEIIRGLAGRAFNWEIEVANLAWIYEEHGQQQVCRFPFGRAA